MTVQYGERREMTLADKDDRDEESEWGVRNWELGTQMHHGRRRFEAATGAGRHEGGRGTLRVPARSGRMTNKAPTYISARSRRTS